MVSMLLLAAHSILFADVTSESGIRFRHRHGGGGDKHMMETFGGGGGFLDYDGDGDLDIYFLQGAPLPGYDGPKPLENALYRNDGGRFTDVTEQAGLTEPGYSLGFAACDYDNDGDPDVYVTSFGENHLYRNNGDGTFRDVTDAAGVGDDRFGSSAAFGDIDSDGDLDLYVANYLAYSLERPLYCGDRSEGIHTYCHPDNFDGIDDVLYRNEGDGTFTDISEEAGVAAHAGKGLGVIFTDTDGDGRVDIYVANDSVMNLFFRNLGEGQFEEIALATGLGFSEEGRAEAGMGVDAGDYDGDGKLDLFVTNYEFETNTLYRNLGGGSFVDQTYRSGLAVPSLPWVGFGTSFFDADNDGDPDLFVANGHIMDHPRFLSDATSYAQRNQLYRNDGGHFEEVSARAGEPFREARVSRGAAFGDFDDDGRVDVLVMNNNDAPNLLRNDSETPHHFTMLRLIGRTSNRDGVGAKVRIEASGRIQYDETHSGSSFLSRNDARLHAGLGAATQIDRLRIDWPSGFSETHEALPAGQLLVLLEGGGLFQVMLSW